MHFVILPPLTPRHVRLLPAQLRVRGASVDREMRRVDEVIERSVKPHLEKVVALEKELAALRASANDRRTDDRRTDDRRTNDRRTNDEQSTNDRRTIAERSQNDLPSLRT